MNPRIKLGSVLRALEGSAWAILPEKLAEIVELIEFKATGGVLSADEIAARIGEPQKRSPQRRSVVAVLPLYGTIVQRANLVTQYSGGTSAEQFGRDFDAVLNDDTVTAILIDADSPGGSVYGVAELCDRIHAARGKKPIIAIANPLMASAAYWIASAADEVIATPSGDAGSIGVFAVHTEFSKADEIEGIRRTVIRAGKYKAEGNPFEPLSDEARAHMQSVIDDSYDGFVAAVARNRGVKEAAVRAGFGQGRLLTARQALAEGVIDRIATMDEILEEMGAGGGTVTTAAASTPAPALAASASVGADPVRIVEFSPRADEDEDDLEEDDEDETKEGRRPDGAAPVAVIEAPPPAPAAKEISVEENTAAQNGAASGAAVVDPPAKVEVGASDAERQRTKDVLALCQAHGVGMEKAAEYLNGRMSAAQVGLDIARSVRENLAAMTTSPVELTDRERKQYSIRRAIRGQLAQMEGSAREDDSFEREVSEEIRKKLPKEYKPRGGILVPAFGRASDFQVNRDALARIAQIDPVAFARFAALNVGVGSAGGNTVFTDGGDLIDMLRPRMKLAALGATILSGLRSPIGFPRQTGASAWTWVAENPGEDVADSDAVIGQVLLSPKSGAASTAYSRQLLTESSIDIDGFVNNDLNLIAALGIDKAGINGSGAANEPTGLLNAAGVNVVPLGDNGLAPTWAHIVDLETQVAVDDADIGTLAYLTTPGIRGKLKTTEKATNTGMFVWEGSELNGYRAEVSTQVPKNLVKGSSGAVCHAILFGVFSQLMIGYFGAYELIVDPYRLKKQGLIEVTAYQMVGIAIRNPESFAVVKDALAS